MQEIFKLLLALWGVVTGLYNIFKAKKRENEQKIIEEADWLWYVEFLERQSNNPVPLSNEKRRLSV